MIKDKTHTASVRRYNVYTRLFVLHRSNYSLLTSLMSGLLFQRLLSFLSPSLYSFLLIFSLPLSGKDLSLSLSLLSLSLSIQAEMLIYTYVVFSTASPHLWLLLSFFP